MECAHFRRSRLFYRTNQAWTVAFAACVYALLLPRFKDYAYMLLLIPAWMAVRNVEARRLWSWLPLLVVLPATQTFLPTGAWTARIMEYMPWISAVVLAATISTHAKRESARLAGLG